MIKNIFIYLLIGIVLCGNFSVACADEATYNIFSDGDVYVDIMVSNDSPISMVKQDVLLDLSHNTELDVDDVYCKVHAYYELYNSDTEETTFFIAKPEILKVKEKVLTKEELESFDSGARMTLDGSDVKGMIYAGDNVSTILDKSVYNTRQDTFEHFTYNTFLNEAIFAFGGKNEDILANKYDGLLQDKPQTYYYEDSEGEERLCAKVFKITLGPAMTCNIEFTQELHGLMKRQTKYTTKGATYSFGYNYGGMTNFFSVGELNFRFKLPENLPLYDCSTSRYLDDETWTIKNLAIPKNFTFTVGTPMSAKEVNDINATHGIGKKIAYVAEMGGYVLLILSFIMGTLTIVRRVKSGIRAR